MNRRGEPNPTAYPASYVQRGIWFTERTATAAGAFHMALSLRFTGPLDQRALRSAVDAVVRRHAILGMAVGGSDGEPFLVPAAAQPTLIRVPYRATLVRETVEQRFALRQGPLSRFVLTSESPDCHVLVVVAHHLVFDGMSKEILVRDLAASYNAATGQVAGDRFADGNAGYGEALAAQQDREADQLEPAKTYWQAAWREPNEALLPGLQRTPTSSEPGASHDFLLDGRLAADLTRAADVLGATRFELLLSAVHLLLRRYGNRDGVVAVDLSTRTAEARHGIGPFVNELPVGAPGQERPTFRSYVREMRAQLRGLYRIRAVPVSRVMPGMRPRLALAPVSLSYRRQNPEEPVFTTLDTTVNWTIPNHSARNALQIQIVDKGSSLWVSLQHSPSAIAPEAVARIAAHLRRLLEGCLADVEAPADQVALLDGDESRSVLVAFNATERPYPADATLLSLFRAQVESARDRPAVVAGGTTWTYGDLDVAARRLAAFLRARGVQPGDLVGVALERSATMLALLLATTMVGAAYVPIDPAYPAERQRLIVADAQPVLVLDSEPMIDSDGVVPETTPGPDPEHLAYVIYTSGSTGQPKGVEISHRSLGNLLLAMGEELGSTGDDVWLAHTSLSFDISALELFLPLVSGGCVVLASLSEAKSPASLLGLIRAHGVTHLQATPSGWRMLLGGGLGAAGSDHASLVALAGGEALPATLAREIRGRVGRLFNLYGPTETTIWSTIYEVPWPAGQITIGRPIANTQTYVCDADLSPLPIGLPGDLYIGGAGLAVGYHHRPDLTAEGFVHNPFGPSGTRLYRTGDRASWLPDGRLVFHGRLDDLVKIRGHRVELGEIVCRLLEHPAVAAATAAVHPDHAEQPSLVGYLTLRDGADPPAPEELRTLLRRTLPAAMVPTAWVTLDRLPLTPNGKVDRAALPPPADVPQAGPKPTPADATSPTLTLLLPMWRDALRRPQTGPTDDLFDLGGHSLTVIDLIDRIRAELGVEVPLDAFYDDPTASAVAAVVDRLRTSAAAGSGMNPATIHHRRAGSARRSSAT